MTREVFRKHWQPAGRRYYDNETAMERVASMTRGDRGRDPMGNKETTHSLLSFSMDLHHSSPTPSPDHDNAGWDLGLHEEYPKNQNGEIVPVGTDASHIAPAPNREEKPGEDADDGWDETMCLAAKIWKAQEEYLQGRYGGAISSVNYGWGTCGLRDGTGAATSAKVYLENRSFVLSSWATFAAPNAIEHEEIHWPPE